MVNCRRPTNERGAVAGLEVLALGILVLVTMVLVLSAAWGVVDSRAALDDAAREYLRTYTEQPDAAAAATAAGSAARQLLVQRGTPLRSLRVVAPDASQFGPCATARVELHATVPQLRLPFGHRFGATDVVAVAEELVDAHKEVLRGQAYDPARTVCAAP
jgi:hypothetical protein